MKKYLLFSIVCLAVFISIAGCGNKIGSVTTDEAIQVQDTLDKTTDINEAVEKENRAALGEMATSENGIYQILVPVGWSVCKDKIDQSMIFELQGQTQDRYIGILVLDKSSYGEFDLAAFMDSYGEKAKVQYGEVLIDEKTPIEINGNAAYSLRISGSVDNVSYMNYVYVVDYENEKVVFTASTYPESEEEVKHALNDIAVSFVRVE